MAKDFRAVLQGVQDSSATYVLVPVSIMKAFAGRVRVPVHMRINGVEHRTTICDMGLGPTLGVPSAIRKAAKIERGDRILVTVDEDKNVRTIAVPADLRKAMTASERKTFDGLAYSHRKEYVLWIEDAKKPETRATADVMFRIGDLAEAKAFYHEALGFPIVTENERVIGFDTGAIVIYFERGEPNGAVFEFEVSDVQAAKVQLLRDGCTLVEENPALPRCYMLDKFGVTFNLTQTFS